ncbi:MAG: hypothetical protein HY551_05175 [Elusimicrobia bacterium]|nr:hypothetical protein [Elusimicrobiota bacterium]
MRILRNSHVLVLAATGLVFLGFSARAAKTPSGEGELKPVLIEGVSRIQMKGDKPVFIPKVDPSRPVGDALTQRLQSVNPSSPESKFSINFPIFLPPRLESDMIYSPWNHRLVRPPVLSLNLKVPPRLILDHWRLIITDDKGKVFFMRKGKGRLPTHLEWDGLGTKGYPIQVGHPYAYSLQLLDLASVPTYISGKTVRVASFVHEQGRSFTISIVTDRLFTAGHAFSAEGKSLMREVRDLLRKHLDNDIAVGVYSLDGELALRQAELIRKYLGDTLHLRERDISARGVTVEEDGYMRTEIRAKL